MLKSGDVLGPYELLRRLGSGTFGEVWLANKQLQINDLAIHVAIKIPTLAGANPDAVIREARLLTKLNGHTNVINITGASIINHAVVIESEFVNGGSLKEWLGQFSGDCLPPQDKCISIMSQILSGLAFVHSNNIVHRDLKPANILLQGETPKIADFGLARLLETTNPTFGWGGTIPYMAPEAFSGARTIKTDIWAVGVMLYEMIAGFRPFRTGDPRGLEWAIKHNEPTPLPSDTSPLLSQIIAKALEKDPNYRYNTAYDMMCQLEGLSKHLNRITTIRGLSYKQRAEAILRIISNVESFVPVSYLSKSQLSLIGKAKLMPNEELLGFVDIRGWFFWLQTGRFVVFTDKRVVCVYDKDTFYIDYNDFSKAKFEMHLHRDSTGRSVTYWAEITFGKTKFIPSGDETLVGRVKRMLDLTTIFLCE